MACMCVCVCACMSPPPRILIATHMSLNNWLNKLYIAFWFLYTTPILLIFQIGYVRPLIAKLIVDCQEY